MKTNEKLLSTEVRCYYVYNKSKKVFQLKVDAPIKKEFLQPIKQLT
jgi:hypothetical protein